MTTIQFTRSHGRLTGFTSVGHSGYAEAGEDVVCAVITSAIRLTECIIDDVLMAGADVVLDDRNTRISLFLDPKGPNYDSCEAVLKGFYLTIKEYEKEDPDHLTVLEV